MPNGPRGLRTSRDRRTSSQRRTEVGELLRRLSSDLQEVGRDFGGRHEMNPSDVRALVLVLDAQRRGVDIGPSALAADLGMSAASVTALVDRLESVGHLRREPDPHDRRRVVLHVGDDAQRLGGQYFGGLQRRIDEATREFSDRDLGAVERYLNAAISAVEEHMEQPPS
ncbi:MAG: MarR family winged helix-turn-helix transcriptional regulator [Candidatus Nanopelagicales bacterium]